MAVFIVCQTKMTDATLKLLGSYACDSLRLSMGIFERNICNTR